MRKVLVVVAVLGALVFSAAPARALVSDINNLPQTLLDAKYSDFSDLYVPPDTGTTYTPLLFGTLPAVGNEDRAIFNTTSIQLPNTTPVWYPISQQATGLFYNLKVISVSVSGSTVTLDFGQSTRNPLPGTPAGMGGVIEIYRNTAMNFNADPGNVDASPGPLCPLLPKTIATVNSTIPAAWGPSYWVQGSGGASRDTYAGSSSGTLWLSGVFDSYADVGIAGHAAGTVFSENYDLTTGVGKAQGYIHLIDGSYDSLIGKGDMGFGPNVDLLLISDLALPNTPDGVNLLQSPNYSGVGWWPVDSQDPVSFQVIPEPATMTLLGLGLLGIGAIRRRVKKS